MPEQPEPDAQQQQSDEQSETTAQDFEFTDSSFKRTQEHGDMQKRDSQQSTTKKEQGS